jgi:hypothetical protein
MTGVTTLTARPGRTTGVDPGMIGETTLTTRRGPAASRRAGAGHGGTS